MTPSDYFEINLDVRRCRREDITIELNQNSIIVNIRKVKKKLKKTTL